MKTLSYTEWRARYAEVPDILVNDRGGGRDHPRRPQVGDARLPRRLRIAARDRPA